MPASVRPRSDVIGYKGSEYKSSFSEYSYQPRQHGYKPDSQPLRMDATMETTTTNRLDFVEHPVEKRHLIKPADGNMKQEGEIDFTSSYNQTFQGQTGERRQLIRPNRERDHLGKFTGEPSYKADFKEWSLPPRHRREADKWLPPTERFEGGSITKRDYLEHELSPRENFRPQEIWRTPEVPFADSTGYRESFHVHPLPSRPPRRREEWTKPAAKFEGTTTKQSDFTGPYQPKRDSFRPSGGAFSSDAPFEGVTTFKSDYVEKPVGKRYVHMGQQYVKPEGEIDLNTTNQTMFREHPLERHTIEKPTSSHILRGSGPFSKDTGYSSDFLEHPAARREIMKPKANYEPSGIKFDGQTTSKEDYVEKQLSPRESYRPRWDPIHSDTPFENSTDYRASFTAQPLPPRRMREQEKYAAPSVPFEASTTFKESYQGQYLPKRHSFKPDQAPLATDIKFESSTTFKNDFKEHEISPRFRHEADRYVRPEGVMDLTTINRETFRDVRADKSTIQKPQSSHLLKREGKMDTRSSYTGDFGAPPVQPREIMKAKSDYRPSSDKFDAISTNTATFTGAYAPKRESCKPEYRPLQNLGAFEDLNVQRDDYSRERYTWQDFHAEVPPVSG